MLTSQDEETFLTAFQAISTRPPSGHAEIAPYFFYYLGSHSSMHPRLSVITQNLAPSFIHEVAGNRRRSDVLLGCARQLINHDTDALPHTHLSFSRIEQELMHALAGGMGISRYDAMKLT